MASYSSATSSDHNKKYQYDVFLSFSGEDTRRSFVDHLNQALQGQGIRTFKDDERLQKGKEIKEELLKSIEDSRFCIIIFSKKYASSSWCLDELVKIMECQKTADQTAFPVFYDVEPTEVRKQSGSVGEAFDKHANKVVVWKPLTKTVLKKALDRHTNKKKGKWRKALKDAANLCGWELKNTAQGHEAKVVKLIVGRVSLELRSINTDVDENLVGMEQRMQDLDPYLDIDMDDVRMVGIKGMGGAGKTTLARAIFDKLSINFEGKSFVENVREKASRVGLEKLQEQVLRDVLMHEDNVSGVHDGKNLIKTKLCCKKVLVVLDDVDHVNQLEALAHDPSWFKQGSRIIITTRDEQVLIAHKIEMIKDVDLLSDKEAIRLFSRHAFREHIPTHEYEMQSLDQVVCYAGGLPLTIKVLGSFLCGKNKYEWKDALARLKTIPLKESLKVLELSYESLEDDYKEIFLDVACILRHWTKNEAILMLESCGFHAANGLRVLEQKSLIKTVEPFDEGGYISMHDRIVEMGENIVRREHPNDPDRHSRLWDQEEIEYVLANDLGSEASKCIYLRITPRINLKGLGYMKKLRCLIVGNFYFVKTDTTHIYFPNSLQYLNWRGYPYWCLPKTFEANNLVTLEMPCSKIEQLWEGEKVMKKLKYLDLRYSIKLRSLDLGLTPNLERLNLETCYRLVKLDVHGGCLKSLIYLNLSYCLSLKSVFFIEQFEQLESLEVLHIGNLNLNESLEVLDKRDYIFTGPSINSLRELDLSGNSIKEVPSSIGNLHKLVSLDLSLSRNLKGLPGSIWSLQHLRTLNLQFTGIKELPEDLGQLECLENLYLYGTEVKHLPGSICMLKHLKTLLLWGCDFLENLPEDVGQLESLEKLDLKFCLNLRELPNSICKLKCLKELLLYGCERLEKLPDELGDLKRLQVLDVKRTGIIHLPQSISLLKGLKIHRSELKDLKTLDLSRCVIEEVPEALGQLECLEELHLNCKNVKRLPDTIRMLKHLKKLFLVSCLDLEKLPDGVGQLESLEEIYLLRCYFIRDILNNICMLKHLKMLVLESCGSIEELPAALGHSECLEELHLRDTDVKHLPDSICMLKHLKKLVLQRCVLLEKLPDDVGLLEYLEELELSRCYSIREIPSSTRMLKQLKVLDLYHCFCLERLPEDVGQLESLEELYLIRCYNIREIPSGICMLKHLKKLHLEGCRRLEKLPDELGVIKSLQFLVIWDTGISHLPQSICLLNGLKISGFILHTKAQSSWSSSLLRNKRKVFFHEELDIQEAAGSSKKRQKCSWE